MKNTRGLALGILFLAPLLAGCPHRMLVKGPGDPAWGVRVTWLGHSCFLFEDSVARKILIDPFDETVGYAMPWVKPDATLITHEHFDHDSLIHVTGSEVLESTGVHTVAGIEVTALLGDHDEEGGRRNGKVRFYVWNMGGLRLAHLSDVGQKALTEEQLKGLGKVDVLFVPVGGKTTVDAADAEALVRQVNPRVAIPMHYGTDRVRFFVFDPVEPFLARFKSVVKVPDASFQLREEGLPESTAVFVPQIPR